MTDSGRESLAARFRSHFAGSDHLYAVVAGVLAADLEAGGPTAQVCAGWESAPRGAVVQLRLLAGLHRLVLRGEAPELAPWYAVEDASDPHDPRLPGLVRAVVAGAVPTLHADLDVAPQTNEVGRTVALLVGMAAAVRAHGLARVRLLEVGASAGLGLLVDHYRFVGDGWAAGPNGAAVVIDGCAAQGFEPAAFEVVSRRGCDLQPVDAGTEDGATRLVSFVWPHHRARQARIRGAIATARSLGPVVVDRAPAGEWLERQLATPPEPGVLTVLWQSITRQYWPGEESARVASAIDAAQARMPVAHVSMEPPEHSPERVSDHSGDWPEIRLDGRLLGRCDYHGPPVTLVD